MDSTANISIRIRLMRKEDVKTVGLLCRQLGYEMNPEVLRERFILVESREDHRVWIAENETGNPVGMVHVMEGKSLLLTKTVEILGLVVDEPYRHQGIGGMLIHYVEQWAKQRNCGAVRLNSNIIRKSAHLFYERCGYIKLKEQYTYIKQFQG